MLGRLASTSLTQEVILCKDSMSFNSRLNRSKVVKLSKEKRLQVRKNGGRWGHGRFARFNFMPKQKFKIHHILGGISDHSHRPLCTFATTPKVALAGKLREACTTPPVFQSLAWGVGGNKHIYGDIFHTLSRDVKGLGSAGEPADWISALVAIPRFCNLKASWRKNTHKKENWAGLRWLRCYQGVLWYVTWLSVIKQSWSTLLYLCMICQGYYSLHEL